MLTRRPHSLCLAAAVLACGLASTRPAAASPGRELELGLVAGAGVWPKKVRAKSCGWFGVRAGHRFVPIEGLERVQLVARAGWEGCFGRQRNGDRVDIVYASFTGLVDVQVLDWLSLNWAAGGGLLLGDTTVGPGRGKTFPRVATHTGPGATAALGDWVYVDVSLFLLFFENFGFGRKPRDTVTSFVPNLTFGVRL